MDGNDLAVFNRAVQYAQEGNKEKAFEFIKALAQKDANNLDLILWGIYTAPNVERASLLLNRAKLIKPDDVATQQAEQWLTNEKNDWPQPEEVFPFFPPKKYFAQNIGQSTTQVILPMQPSIPAQPVMPTQQIFNIQPQTFIAPQPIIINTAPVYSCPYYRSPYPPLTSTRISTGGWITFAILLILFFPLCWVGFFSKTSYQYCAQCGVKFN